MVCSKFNNRNEKLVCFLHDSKFIQADVYAAFHRMMKLGIKQLYIDNQVKVVKGKPMVEENEVFFASTINVSKYTFFYIRCYRIFAMMLKELDPSLYDNLYKKRIEPPMFFLYNFC